MAHRAILARLPTAKCPLGQQPLSIVKAASVATDKVITRPRSDYLEKAPFWISQLRALAKRLTRNLSKGRYQMRYFLAFSVSAVLAVSTAIAQDKSEVELQAADDLSYEYTICSMYYLIRSQCLASRRDAGALMLAARSNEALDAAAEYSLSFGKQAGLLPRAIIKRQKFAYQEQSGKLKNCSKISKLTLEYADSCQAIMQNPGDAFFNKLQQQQQVWE
jgi:hypothetical protein